MEMVNFLDQDAGKATGATGGCGEITKLMGASGCGLMFNMC